MLKKLISALFLSTALIAGTEALASEPTISEGSITIPVKEYEKLKEAFETKKENQWWKMTFEQILDKKGGDEKKAWQIYEYYVLRRLHIFGTVGSNTTDLSTDINVLNEIDDTKPITLIISSPGGYVYNGLIFYNAMLASKAPIHTVCDGVAASMAAVLLAAGDYRSATPACHWMIHEVGGGDRMSGQTMDFIKLGEFIVDLENILFDIIAKNTGLSMADVRRLAEFETFYDSEELLRLGVVDEVFDDRPRNLDGTRQLPDDLLPLNRMKKNLTEKLTR